MLICAILESGDKTSVLNFSLEELLQRKCIADIPEGQTKKSQHLTHEHCRSNADALVNYCKYMLIFLSVVHCEAAGFVSSYSANLWEQKREMNWDAQQSYGEDGSKLVAIFLWKI